MEVERDDQVFEIWLFGQVFEIQFLLWAVVESDQFVNLLWIAFFIILSWQVNQFLGLNVSQEVFDPESANGTSTRRWVK